MVIVDEISFAGETLLNNLNKKLNMLKSDPQNLEKWPQTTWKVEQSKSEPPKTRKFLNFHKPTNKMAQVSPRAVNDDSWYDEPEEDENLL